MITKNPVLYALENLRSGRSTGAFKGVQSTPQLSDVSTQRAEATTSYLSQLKEAEAKSAPQVGEYDALIASLSESVSGKKGAYENLGTTLKSQVEELKGAYDTALNQVTPQVEAAKNTYATAVTPRPEQLAAAKGSYDTAIAPLAGQAAGAKSAYESVLASATAQRDALPSNAAYKEAAISLAGLKANYKKLGGDSYKHAEQWRADIAAAQAKVDAFVNPIKSLYSGAGSTYQQALDAINASSSQAQTSYQAILESAKATSTAAESAYKAATDTASAQLKAAYDPYQAAATSAQSQLDAAYKEYLATSTSADVQSKEAYQRVYGEQERLSNEFKQKQQDLGSLGYLAFSGPTTESASPTVSTGSTLAATDLYSNTLESQMLGRKQLAQTASVNPEEDIMAGAMQSSLYAS